jgi:hypothetical protein
VAQTGADRSYFQMECLAICAEAALIDASVRFLHLVARDSRQAAAEHEVSVDSLPIAVLVASPHLENFSLAGVQGEIEISAAPVQERVFRLKARIRNTTACQPEIRDDALLHSLASAHAVLQIRDGKFVSQIDPPEELREPVAVCQNTGVWPVLVGDCSASDTMLRSPIILYSYPQVAPESKGDLFDATEIDEILSLRILTLTDEEMEEVRRSDERARHILERLDAGLPEHLLELHGTIRAMRPIIAVG